MILVATMTGWPLYPWILKAESTVVIVIDTEFSTDDSDMIISRKKYDVVIACLNPIEAIDSGSIEVGFVEENEANREMGAFQQGALHGTALNRVEESLRRQPDPRFAVGRRRRGFFIAAVDGFVEQDEVVGVKEGLIVLDVVLDDDEEKEAEDEGEKEGETAAQIPPEDVINYPQFADFFHPRILAG